MDHEESLANINFDKLVLLEQTQAMKENTATTPPPVADEQRRNSGKESSDKVVIGAKSALKMRLQFPSVNDENDYTFEQYMAERLAKKSE